MRHWNAERSSGTVFPYGFLDIQAFHVFASAAGQKLLPRPWLLCNPVVHTDLAFPKDMHPGHVTHVSILNGRGRCENKFGTQLPLIILPTSANILMFAEVGRTWSLSLDSDCCLARKTANVSHTPCHVENKLKSTPWKATMKVLMIMRSYTT